MKGTTLLKKASKTAKYKVVFVRHGESEFNKLNRFTGWQDVRLTELGINQAQ
jgi:2,3-bisphosphoglycerate-dependent phosphoglycerate mutase